MKLDKLLLGLRYCSPVEVGGKEPIGKIVHFGGRLPTSAEAAEHVFGSDS